ncbi:MAG: serine/threonine protein kinase [Cyanobacteria bacterium]|nr:serine/threonine protein kinase [Cyanobacteriota bacterium]
MNNGSHPSRVGRYSIVECVGTGALGSVYSGVDDAMGRRVAIRVGRAGDPRVHQQARATGQVAHPNVVSVLDLGEDNGSPFTVMELLEGPSLLHATFATVEDRLTAMHQICDGLQAAHDCGVVHGGLKPGHVFVETTGAVKIIDFGGDGRGHVFTSPEQSAGVPADSRSDIYSAAAVFHFMLTGRGPHPPSLMPKQAPEGLSRAILKGVEAEPARRQASINHLRAEIDQVRSSRQGDRQRILIAAFDRYRDIESLLGQRRALGRRLGMASIEGECDAKLAQLAAGFPEFARAGLDINNVGDIDPARANEALTELQMFHNDVAAEIAVLKAASGVRHR